MAGHLLDELFIPPILETGDRVTRQHSEETSPKHGTVVSSGGWFAIIRWDDGPSLRREYIPDLEVEQS